MKFFKTLHDENYETCLSKIVINIFFEKGRTRYMDKRIKFVLMLQIIFISFTISTFFITLNVIEDPEDYLPDRISNPTRKGTINGYTFLDWENLMSNQSLAEEYMDLAARSLNCTYVHCQWSIVGLDNDTLNLDYLDNLTLWIKGMAERNVKTLIYTWVSAYSPDWMIEYTPELVNPETGKIRTCWYGIDPNTSNQTKLLHRNNLKNSMLRYYEMLIDYFIGEGVMNNITGFNLDDETNIDPDSPDGKSYWNDFFADITDYIHSRNANWEVHAMWLSRETYEIAGIAGFDINAFDAYTQDAEIVQRITYSYMYSGVEKASVVLSAMYLPEDMVSMIQAQRQAWICWFMGVDSIGWYSFYYGDMSGDSWTCAILHYTEEVPMGPERTAKTDAVEEIADDFYNLNRAWEKIESSGRSSDVGKLLEKRLLRAYYYAKASKFDRARTILSEVVNA